MSAIGPGDWVECVDGIAEPLGFRIGGIYRVLEVLDMGRDCDGCSGCHRTGLMLQGVLPIFPGTRAGYVCSTAFRPIYRPNSEFITELLTDIPALIPEDA